jgi:hypothetical protein
MEADKLAVTYNNMCQSLKYVYLLNHANSEPQWLSHESDWLRLNGWCSVPLGSRIFLFTNISKPTPGPAVLFIGTLR